MIGTFAETAVAPRVNIAKTSALSIAGISPAHATLALIVISAILRIAFGAMLGLGIDESYTVATARVLQLSYFDHPPLAWWVSGLTSQLVGSDAALAVRLPFIMLFALSTWLMYRLGAILFGGRAGFLSALLLNLSPVFGVTTASWVLPDGPLDCALLGTAFCLIQALNRDPGQALPWWLGVGLCAGLALLSKYMAFLVLGGIPVALLTDRKHRFWFARPEPYVAAMIAVFLFTPVLVWNANHGWASFLFQGGRASGTHFRLWRPVATLAGEMVFLLPWIGLPLFALFGAALLQGTRNQKSWLLCCLAAPPIIAFAAISIWSNRTMLYHWAAPGYLFLLPLLGKELAERIARGQRWVRRGLVATTTILLSMTAAAATEVRWNWLPEIGEKFALGGDPDLQAVDWNSVATTLAHRRLLAPPGIVVAGANWPAAGKLDYVLHGQVVVTCLCSDAREYGVLHPLKDFVGSDVVIVTSESSSEQFASRYGVYFDTIRPEGPIMIMHSGIPSAILYLYVGHRLR